MIKVSFSSLDSLRHAEVLRDIHIVNKLREAGIPVIGPLSIRGVTSGRLTMYTDMLFGDLVFEWTEHDPFAV